MKKYILVICLSAFTLSAKSQSLKELLDQSKEIYPLYKSKQYDVQAGRDDVSYARSTALPDVDAVYHVNYATYNNITGMAMSQFAPISGPPSPSNDFNGVFGSSGSIILNWEPFTFGRRKSIIKTSEAYLEYQEAEAAKEFLQHEIELIEAYLDAVMAQELIKVYSKNLERAEENKRIVRSLAFNGLRPGVDTVLFNAELSRAKIDLLNFKNMLESLQVMLSGLTGGIIRNFTVDSSYCLTLPLLMDDSVSAENPFITTSSARVKISRNEHSALQHDLYPRLSFWGTFYGRGSGIRYDGFVNSDDGLSFSRYNYGTGLYITLPLLDFTKMHHQLSARNSLIHAEEERLNLVKLQVEKQWEKADINMENAMKIAIESPELFESAQFAYHALITRYNSGLINYSDLVLSQYSLARAEADMKKSYLDSWRALLSKAAARGDLTIFLNQIPD